MDRTLSVTFIVQNVPNYGMCHRVANEMAPIKPEIIRMSYKKWNIQSVYEYKYWLLNTGHCTFLRNIWIWSSNFKILARRHWPIVMIVVIFLTKYGQWKLIMLKAEVGNVRMNVIHRLPPFCAFQTRIFLEHSADNYAPCIVVTFCFYPCALELTQLRDWEIFSSSTVSHINNDTCIFRYIYIFLYYI